MACSIVRTAIEQAMESKIFSHILVTSDIPKSKVNIDDLRSPTAMTRFEYITRPAKLCGDNSLMIDVVRHAMDYLGNGYEYVWLLQPTAPFRKLSDFTYLKKKIEDGYYNSAISFKEVTEHPERMYTVGPGRDGNTKAYPINKNTGFDNRQKLKPVYIRSGNYYVTKRKLLLENGTFENAPLFPYIVERAYGINIDNEEDVVLAKHYVSRGYIKI